MAFIPLRDVFTAMKCSSASSVMSRAVVRVRIVEVSSRGDGKYWYTACAFKLRDRGNEAERFCCRKFPSREGTSSRGHTCSSAGKFLQWHFYVKLGDDSVCRYELEDLPECLVFQAGESLMGCKPSDVDCLQPEEATSLLCGQMRGLWSMGLEMIRGVSGVELKVHTAERISDLSVIDEAPRLPDRLLVDHGWGQQVMTGYQSLHLERTPPSLKDVENHLMLSEAAMERTQRGHEKLTRVFDTVQLELKEACTALEQSRNMLKQLSM